MSARRFKAAIIGGSGYGAGEMLRRLIIHPEVEVVRVASIDHVGKPVWHAHPHLTGLTQLTFEDLAPRDAARGCDVALLALPHKVTAAKVPELIELGVKSGDLSGDVRLTDAGAYATFYGNAHPHPELLGTFVYGLPELHRDKIRAAKHVASPGCFATTIELALLPLAKAGLLAGATAHVVGITGSSGSGAAAQEGTHHPVRAVNLKAYKPLVHQHTPEILETLAAAGASDVQIRFTPVSAPLSRGIFVTVYLELPAASVDDQRLAALYDEAYADEPFVRRPTTRLPEVAAVSGSNYAEVGFVCGEVVGDRRTVVCFAALDNLIKGGAGQAIQNMNLVLGLDERLSLQDPGGWP